MDNKIKEKINQINNINCKIKNIEELIDKISKLENKKDKIEEELQLLIYDIIGKYFNTFVCRVYYGYNDNHKLNIELSNDNEDLIGFKVPYQLLNDLKENIGEYTLKVSNDLTLFEFEFKGV